MNPNLHVVHMEPQSTYRTPLRSDTLWGMICWGIKTLHGETALDKYLQSCLQGKPEFIISSTFPFFQKDNQKHRYFPRPFLRPTIEENASTPLSEKQAVDERKKLKDISLLSEPTFKEVLLGELHGDKLRSHLLGKDKDASDRGPKPRKAPQESGTSVTHNTLNRITWATLERRGRGQLFHTEDLYIEVPMTDKEAKQQAENKGIELKGGLFFLVQGDVTLLKGVFNLWEDIGMGADRSTGKGFFKFSIEPYSFHSSGKYQANPNAWINLSLFMPTQSEALRLQGLDTPHFNYQLQWRKGVIGGVRYQKSFQKQPVIMFAEGSVFPQDEQDWQGCIHEVVKKQPGLGFPVYQNGFALMVPLYIPHS